jgi:hypothetical protein
MSGGVEGRGVWGGAVGRTGGLRVPRQLPKPFANFVFPINLYPNQLLPCQKRGETNSKERLFVQFAVAPRMRKSCAKLRKVALSQNRVFRILILCGHKLRPSPRA